MSTAFLCGSIPPAAFQRMKIRDLNRIVKSIIDENGIDRIYLTKRNDFDIDFYISMQASNIKNVEMVLLADLKNFDTEYRKTIFEGIEFKAFCPFEEPLNKNQLFISLYDYAIDNSDYMITYLKYDDDISAGIAKKAKDKGLKVLNIAEYLESKCFNSTKTIISIKQIGTG